MTGIAAYAAAKSLPIFYLLNKSWAWLGETSKVLFGWEMSKRMLGWCILTYIKLLLYISGGGSIFLGSTNYAARFGEVSADLSIFRVNPGDVAITRSIYFCSFTLLRIPSVDSFLRLPYFSSRLLIPLNTVIKFCLFLRTSGKTWP